MSLSLHPVAPVQTCWSPQDSPHARLSSYWFSEDGQYRSASHPGLWHSEAVVLFLGGATVTKQIEKPSPTNASTTPSEVEKLEDQSRMNRVAEDAANQAGKTEQRYDQEHNLFTK
jgi:hypothetical protein